MSEKTPIPAPAAKSPLAEQTVTSPAAKEQPKLPEAETAEALETPPSEAPPQEPEETIAQTPDSAAVDASKVTAEEIAEEEIAEPDQLQETQRKAKEATLSEEEQQAEINAAWGEEPDGATHLVIQAANADYWTTDEEAIQAHLEKLSVDLTEDNIALEKTKREQINEAAKKLKRVNEADEQGKGNYDPEKDEYTIFGDDDQVAEVIHLSSTVEPVMTGLEDLANDEADPERSKKAKSAQATLEKYVVEDEDGTITGFETKKPPEALTPEERINSMGQEVINDVLNFFAEDEDLLGQLQANPVFTGLVILSNEAPIDSPNARFLSTGVYSQLRLLAENPLAKQLPTDFQQKLNTFLADSDLANGVAMINQAFIDQVAGPILQTKEDQYPHIAEQLKTNSESIFSIYSNVILATQLRSIKPEEMSKFLSQLTRDTGITFTSAERSLLAACNTDSGQEILDATLASMGIKADELTDPSKWISRHAEKVVESVSTEEEKKNSELMEKKKQAVKKLCDIDKAKVEKRIKDLISLSKFGTYGISAAILLSMLQGTFSMGVEEERQH